MTASIALMVNTIAATLRIIRAAALPRSSLPARIQQASATSPCITVAKTTLIRTDVCAWPSVGTTVPVVPDMAASIIRSQLSIAVATLSASAGR